MVKRSLRGVSSQRSDCQSKGRAACCDATSADEETALDLNELSLEARSAAETVLARATAAVRERVGFAVATERSFFPRLSARENLDFFATLDDIPRKRRAERVDELLARTALGDAADTLVMKFSSGMYQRLGIARALIKRPSVVLLDEPTRSLDPGSAAQFWNLVRELPS